MRIIKFSEHDKTDEYSISPDISSSYNNLYKSGLEVWGDWKKTIKTGGDSSKKTQVRFLLSFSSQKPNHLSSNNREYAWPYSNDKVV